eukprot:gene6272-4504_t
MTNIVLNVSKKNQRTTSANASPRVIKDTRSNLNQINDLRAAYGAGALPISKAPSPTRAKSGKSSGISDEYETSEPLPSSLFKSSARESHPVEFSHDLVIEDEISPEAAYMSPTYPEESGYSEVQQRGQQEVETKVMTSSSPGGDGSPLVGRRPSKKSSPTKSARKSTDSLLAESFARRANVRESPSPLSNYESTPEIEILGSSRSDIGGGNEPMFAVPDEILIRPTASNTGASRNGPPVMVNQMKPMPQVDVPYGDEDKLEDYLDFSDNDDVGESYDGSSQRGLSAKIAKLTGANVTNGGTSAESKRQDFDQSAAPNDDESNDSKEFAAVPARPQSRKLYLGNERGSRPTPTIKAPRSAGARYGTYSPLKGSEATTESTTNSSTNNNPAEVRKGAMKRLGSLDNLKSQIWEEEDHVKERPPSRQSSAFPVHLADDGHPTTTDMATGTTSNASTALSAPNSATKNRKRNSSGTPTRGILAALEPESESPTLINKFGGPSPQRGGGGVGGPLAIDNAISSSLSGSPGTIPVVPVMVPVMVSALTSNDTDSNVSSGNTVNNNSISISISNSNNMYLAPNTELRSIKKTRSGGANTAAGGDDEEASVGSAYQKRPPSRQKVAAQHLFDNDPSHEASLNDSSTTASSTRPISTRGGSRPTLSAQNIVPTVDLGGLSGMNPPLTKPPSTSSSSSRGGLSARSQINTARSLTSRSKMHYDPKDDGFGDLDPMHSSIPFVINVNYGASSQSSIEVIPMGEDTVPASRSSTAAPSSTAPMLSSSQTPQPVSLQQSSPYRKPLTDKVLNGRPRITPIVRGDGITGGGHQSLSPALPTSAGSTRSTFPSPYTAPFEPPALRPKSVTNGVVLTNSKLATANATNVSAARKKYASAQQAEAEYHAPDTLRSMSAGHGPHHLAVGINAPSSGGGGSSSSGAMNHPGKVPARAAFGDWTEPDPRLIPRAQNKFGLESDTGWTSPSFNDDLPHYSHPPMHHQVPRPTTYRMNSRSPGSDNGDDNDDDLLVEDYPGPNSGGGGGAGGYHDDDMTIMTEDSGNEAMMMDQSLSLQSFPLESSLGEDFLSLFAPAGPPP